MKTTHVLLLLTARLALVDDGGELAERLAHEARLKADVGIAHVALDLCLGRERRDRVDDDDVHRRGAHEMIDDVERLLARVGLGDVEFVEVHAERLRVDGIERVLRIDEGRDAAQLLRFGNGVQGDRRLTGGFGAVDLDHSAAGKPADAECEVERKAPRGDDFDIGIARLFAELHDGALTVSLLDLGEDGVQRLEFFFVHICSPFAGYFPIHGCIREGRRQPLTSL